MEDRDRQLEEIKLSVARDLAAYISRIASKPEATESELTAMARVAGTVQAIRFDRY
ncbi:MAG: hypothetical protein IJ087_09280 [Eggerthellaceae bacterium]|nr:hypothetical protein [Eggerthellaceae bacterium]